MKNLQLENFDFELNENLIAQHPLPNRHDSKLLVINSLQNQATLQNDMFKNLHNHINSNDLIIFNNTKVVPTKLIATNKNGATLYITLHKQLNSTNWLAFIKNAKRVNINDTLTIAPSFSVSIINKLPSGEVEVKLNASDIASSLNLHGFMPLPPYIKRNYTGNLHNKQQDNARYQSIFAKKEGAVASPTASLHFSQQVINSLQAKNVAIGFVTLHVGAGTFLPVKTNNIAEHKMHSEIGELSQQTIDLIHNCKKNNGRIIAVGTTTLRVLEYVYKTYNQLQPFAGDIDLFVYPPYKFNVVDCLITNFHLPKSTLFMLVCAFGGINQLKQAYAYANSNNYRFFSYGDACFINKMDN